MIEEKDTKAQTEGILKDSLNVNGIMQLATNLMSNKEVMDTFSAVFQPNNNSSTNSKKSHPVNSSGSLDQIELLTGVRQELLYIKTELSDLRKQNDELRDLLMKLNESSKRKKWWKL